MVLQRVKLIIMFPSWFRLVLIWGEKNKNGKKFISPPAVPWVWSKQLRFLCGTEKQPSDVNFCASFIVEITAQKLVDTKSGGFSAF